MSNESTPTDVAAPETNTTETPEVESSTEEASSEAEETLQDSEGSEIQEKEVAEATDQAKDNLDDAKDAEANAKEELEEAIQRYKVIVNGEEKEVTQDELIRGYQTMRAAQEKFEQAASTRKMAERALNLLKKDPARVMSELGIDPRKFSEEYLAGELEKEMLSPEEKKFRDMENELRKYREKEEQAKKSEEEKRQIELDKREAADLNDKVAKALSVSGLPKTQKTLAMVGQYLADAYDMGYTDIQPSDVIELVREDYTALLRDVLGATDGDQLVKLVGEDTVKKIRKYDVDRVKSKTVKSPSDIKPTKSPENPDKQVKPSKKGISDWRAELEKKYR